MIPREQRMKSEVINIKICSSCHYVNFFPYLCVSLHKKFQSNDRNDVVLTSHMIIVGQFDIMSQSFPGAWRMNRVLGPSPTIENEVRSVADNVIMEQTHPRK